MSSNRQTLRNHYVPQWYQRRFLGYGETQFRYLDLAPETILSPGGQKYYRRALLRWGPKRCFVQENLYTLKLGPWSTDAIERYFFGPIDTNGEMAVAFFSDYTLKDGVHEAHSALMQYMDAQRFRTPRGLDHLKTMVETGNQNLVLLTMQHVFQLHATMWTEGVWEIVGAHQSPTKFLLTDEPVTFYNPKAFPLSRDCRYPNDVDLGDLGTRTIFPLSSETCLIVTHVQLVRNPGANPRSRRVNARSYSPTMADLRRIQFGRELDEGEVLRINLILKKRATRYIAAAREEWLYPEVRVSVSHWSNLDHDWFLLPNPYKVPFTTGFVVGYNDGRSWAMDEHGRVPGQRDYSDSALQEREWRRHLRAQIEWALKRNGRSIARIHNDRENQVYDELMKEAVEALHLKHAKRFRDRRNGSF